MTMQAEELLGAQVMGADGKVIGTVEQVFGDDIDGAPAWARIRSGRTSRFVPLDSGQVTKDGISIPFDSQKIMSGPKIEVGEHMSAAQVEELGRYYDLTGPAETGEEAQGQQRGKADEAQGQQRREDTQGQQRGKTGDEWLVRREERLKVGTETLESGHVKLHRYVEDEPAEQTVHLFHEEYDVERVPVAADEGLEGGIEEGEQEITLHEQHGIPSKETVSVERVRLVPKRVEEDKTFRDDVRHERIEVEPEETADGRARNKAR